jgi:hypothetical protein
MPAIGPQHGMVCIARNEWLVCCVQLCRSSRTSHSTSPHKTRGSPKVTAYVAAQVALELIKTQDTSSQAYDKRMTVVTEHQMRQRRTTLFCGDCT